jgi:predicted alpha/beta hydrolase family esterase
MKPSLAEWIECVENENVVFDSNTAVICHSLGCALAFQYLQRSDIKELGLLILVAPTSKSKLESVGLSSLEHFYDGIDIEVIAPKIISSEIYYSYNDIYVDINDVEVLALGLHAETHLVSNAGHLNVASEHTTFPAIFETIFPSFERKF